jgi:hypothetical protein
MNSYAAEIIANDRIRAIRAEAAESQRAAAPEEHVQSGRLDLWAPVRFLLAARDHGIRRRLIQVLGSKAGAARPG